MARASSKARCVGVTDAPRWRARVLSLWLRTSSRPRAYRASRTVSSTALPGHASSQRAAAALRKEMSKPALWATSTAPRLNSRNAGSTCSIRGADTTMASVMPVSAAMNGGIEWPGLTRVASSPTTSPPRTLTAPTSVMPQSAGDPPVVSRSTTTKVTSDSGVPRSSIVDCAQRLRRDCVAPAGRGTPVPAGAPARCRAPCTSPAVEVMARTVRAPSDSGPVPRGRAACPARGCRRWSLASGSAAAGGHRTARRTRGRAP